MNEQIAMTWLNYYECPNMRIRLARLLGLPSR